MGRQSTIDRARASSLGSVGAMASNSARGELLRRLCLTISDHVAAALKHANAVNQAKSPTEPPSWA